MAAVSAVYGAAVSVIVFFAAQQVVSVFTRNSRVVLLGGQYLRGYIWDCIFAGVHFCFSGYFCACQKSYLSFMHNPLSIVLVRIPCSYIAARLFADTLFPMRLAAPLGSLLSVVVCLSAFAVLKRKGACWERRGTNLMRNRLHYPVIDRLYHYILFHCQFL